MYSLIRKCLFSMDAETAHNFSIQALKLAGKLPINVLPMPLNPVEVMGLQFKNPIGLAAGADKNGEAIDGFGKLGFGFIEVGTVTPVAQDGNPKPRQFRILEAEGIINRNGFNNLGVDVLVENVKKAKYDGIIGINIGKNAVTPIERALDDYQICLRKVYEHADYITVNISSPNTKNLRTLQYGEALDDLLRSLKSEQESLSQKFNRYKPLVLKIAPDLTDEEIASVADSLVRYKIDGVIAGNTTLSRDPVVGLKNAEQQGGLSGKPLNTLSTRLISTLAKELNGALPIIGSGGIHSVASGQEKIDAGASLLQVYSAMIYQGPALIQNLAKHIQVR
ncbi:dihydroorotate dehydrogenase [Actinobacillus pleuropneumoniae]|uniref:Dihydroorotate dehydrogenase (quinone) n=1 Tax=Actinobacillus pleuropneumoniae serotype 5b (strain L20) TaxID=416269 RepID=PYRD_ACTP2|nr:quinone-dependent dihydroorotate dehydrogenase [Actinobacillus pleuropneumoniae]A3N0D6.1 RecName: Full=Dihydroorotate dehydrogenase (quinone); AltName: Full=DHOdehase; Short=DHOD; Short=DHODase; AltName: Full=Dihydroorotate oxidase [Actinobacillus pleuropneumoniae serovar 5b str. L20]ABN73872.1 dihydroorotate dehydrogenase [Actinobacillus pleuropneumoniae serovar 5b str. L20]MEE3683783.1 quinone-dependent dihydroorotate dehydrogenase [Actinobacillus pleuropneumoniae]QSZ38790.1 dihydroorotate